MGIGALRTEDVIDLARDAKEAGADAGLLAPVSYQPLTEDEVFALFETVARAVPGGWVAWGDAEECLARKWTYSWVGLFGQFDPLFHLRCPRVHHGGLNENWFCCHPPAQLFGHLMNLLPVFTNR